MAIVDDMVVVGRSSSHRGWGVGWVAIDRDYPGMHAATPSTHPPALLATDHHGMHAAGASILVMRAGGGSDEGTGC